MRCGTDNREIDPHLPIESFQDRGCAVSPIHASVFNDRGSRTGSRARVRAKDGKVCSSRSTAQTGIQISAGRPPSRVSLAAPEVLQPQPGNPRGRVHLIIIAEGAGGAARCPLNRSSTTSAPPPRNYESLRERDSTAHVHAAPCTGCRVRSLRQVLHAKVRGARYSRRADPRPRRERDRDRPREGESEISTLYRSSGMIMTVLKKAHERETARSGRIAESVRHSRRSGLV